MNRAGKESEMKPPGMNFTLRGGALCLETTHSDRVSDSIWDAVQEAISANWSVERFKREASAAWDHELSERRKTEMKEWDKP